MQELIASRYRIDRPLAVGSTAFQAFDLQLSRTVVIKSLPTHRLKDARFARQFFQEAAAAAGLMHPNLVGIYDVSENGAHARGSNSDGPDPFMVLEWVPGNDLQFYLDRREPLPSEEMDDPFERKLELLIHACRGLHYGHEFGLVHGSVHPQNIRVTPVRDLKILNFGITPLRKNGDWHYLSPEQVEKKAKPDRRSDVFSLGVILYELLFGVHPFRGETDEATCSRILAGEYTPVDDLLPGSAHQLSEIVSHSLAHDPADRFTDCRLLESELKALRSRFSQEREDCRARLVSLRAALKKDTRSGQARHFDLAVLESADPSSEDYEHLLRSCNQLEVIIERLKSQAQIEKTIDSAESEASAGEMDSALALIKEVLSKDPGNARACAVEAAIRRRQEVNTLLQEARRAESADDVALSCILALQATELAPDALDAKAEFERLQAILRQRKEPSSSVLIRTAPQPGSVASAFRHARGGLLNRRLLTRVAPIVGVLLVLGLVWVMLTREDSGPPPVSARNVPTQPKPEPPRQALVSLDVVPWAKVESIIDLKSGKAVAHQELESPCTFQLPVGRYALTVSHPEFGSRHVPLEVRDGITNRVQVSLLSEPQLEKEVRLNRR